MFDETNPIMEWSNEDEEGPTLDGPDAACAMFEKIRRLNSSRKDSYVVTKRNNKKRKMNDDEQNDYVDTESEDDEEENEYVDNEGENNEGVSENDEDDPSMHDQQETQMPIKKETQTQVEKQTPTSDGNLETRRSGRLANKTKDVNTTKLFP